MLCGGFLFYGLQMPREEIRLTTEIKERIIDRVALGESMNQICKDPDITYRSAVYKAFHRDPEFRKDFERAVEQATLARLDKLDDITDRLLNPADHDDGGIDPSAAKVAADIIKWDLSRRETRKFNAKQSHMNVKFKFDKNAPPHIQASYAIEAVANGEIPVDIASAFISSIKDIVSIEEFTELKDRIENLEKALNG